jgi:transposase
VAARTPKLCYWQDAPVPRSQLVLFATTLDERIPEDHPVRLLDEILDELDWCEWEAKYDGNMGKRKNRPQGWS